MNSLKTLVFIAFLIATSSVCRTQPNSLSLAQTKKKPNVGVIYSKPATIQNGYVLLVPSNFTKTFLINNEGRLINQWSSNYLPGQSAYLMEDGSLIRSCKSDNTVFRLGGIGGRLEKKDWNDQLLWEWELNDSNKCLHHDITPLPNGNILVIMIERKFFKDVFLSGRDTAKLNEKELWTESVLEIKPKGKNEAIIVWQWSAWDHLTQDKYPSFSNYSKATHPELIDINYNLDLNSNADFLHFNSIDYNPQTNQILLSVRNYHEIWIIDHSTTTAQAKTHKGGKTGKGGDLIYRWGNPKAYGINESALLDGQHCASWIKKGSINEGKITIFDNRGTTRSSRLVMLSPALNKATFNYNSGPDKCYLPKAEEWFYTQVGLSEGRGGAIQGLPNGNMLFCETSKGKLTEISLKGDTSWIYAVPVSVEGVLSQGELGKNPGSVFKADKYALSFKGFEGKTLTPGAKLELNPDMQFGKIEMNKSLDTLKTITLSLTSGNCYLTIDEVRLFSNQPISVYNASGLLIDKQTIPAKGKWYLGLYKEGTYYFECKKRYVKVNISK